MVLTVRRRSGHSMRSALSTIFWQMRLRITKRKRQFITVVENKTLKLLRSLVHPQNRETRRSKSWLHLWSLTSHHSHPRSCSDSSFIPDFAVREKQWPRVVSTGWVLQVWRWIEGSTLRDHLVCGICDEKIQAKLLAVSDLAWRPWLFIVQSVETVAQNVKDLKATSEGSAAADKPPVNKVHAGKAKSLNQPNTCHRCG